MPIVCHAYCPRHAYSLSRLLSASRQAYDSCHATPMSCNAHGPHHVRHAFGLSLLWSVKTRLWSVTVCHVTLMIYHATPMVCHVTPVLCHVTPVRVSVPPACAIAVSRPTAFPYDDHMCDSPFPICYHHTIDMNLHTIECVYHTS